MRYNERGEVISASSTAVSDYDFNYDAIGNRTNYQKDQLKAQGTFNDLNQLTKLNYLGTLPYNGSVSASSGNLSTVSVDGTAESGVSGNTSVTLTGTVTTKNNKKIIVLAEDTQGRKSSTVKDVPNEFNSTYDANGNLKTELNRDYYWNCENRLVRMDITDGEKVTKLEFAYDFMGRRVSKKVYIKADAESSFVLDSSYAFLYIGFKLIAKLDATDSNALVQNFVWQPGAVGLDIPLNVYDAGDDANYFYLSDANKNIGQLVDSTGTIKAKYEYSPFGRITTQSGDYASTNPLRFSSEYYDSETKLVYYNYRYYSPKLGRWLSRDPIEESGGFNLYGMVENNPVNKRDKLGLAALRKQRIFDFEYYPGLNGTVCSSPGAITAHKVQAFKTEHATNLRQGKWFARKEIWRGLTSTLNFTGNNIIPSLIEIIGGPSIPPTNLFMLELWEKYADQLADFKTYQHDSTQFCECVESGNNYCIWACGSRTKKRRLLIKTEKGVKYRSKHYYQTYNRGKIGSHPEFSTERD